MITAAEETPWKLELIESWTNAAIHYHDRTWIALLWRWWSAFTKMLDPALSRHRVVDSLFQVLPLEDAEAEIILLLDSGDLSSIATAADLLNRTPSEWSVPASDAYVKMLGWIASQLPQLTRSVGGPGLAAILQSIPIAARRLSHTSFNHVPRTWNLADDRSLYQWQAALDTLVVITELRQYVRHEIEAMREREP
jgi:hypothetical protein